MSPAASRVMTWIAAFGLLFISSFLAGYLLLKRSGSGTDSPGPVVAAGDSEAAGRPIARAVDPEAVAAGAARVPAPLAPEIAGRGVLVAGAVPGASAEATRLSFDATVYDLRVAPDQIGHLDMEALGKAAASAEGFERALAGLGTARPLYRANHGATLDEEEVLVVSSAKPEAVDTAGAMARGGALPPGATGASFDFIAKRGDGGSIEVDIAIKASILLQATTPGATTTPGAPAPRVRAGETMQHLNITPDKPFLLLNADATTLDASGKAVVLITRVMIGKPVPEAPGR